MFFSVQKKSPYFVRGLCLVAVINILNDRFFRRSFLAIPGSSAFTISSAYFTGGVAGAYLPTIIMTKWVLPLISSYKLPKLFIGLACIFSSLFKNKLTGKKVTAIIFRTIAFPEQFNLCILLPCVKYFERGCGNVFTNGVNINFLFAS